MIGYKSGENSGFIVSELALGSGKQDIIDQINNESRQKLDIALFCNLGKGSEKGVPKFFIRLNASPENPALNGYYPSRLAYRIFRSLL